jgi:oligoribonuclease NrnB/cAMP/cGMP phosphodiesterase (DHH superfamily)
MNLLTESRMKELSANDMDVWVFDTKRNSNVQRGRLEMEMINKRRQESIVDLEMDFLAPYLQRFPDTSSLTKAQAMEVITKDHTLIWFLKVNDSLEYKSAF